MKKKMLSFLCALAMLVSMTTIGSVVAFADGTAKFGGLEDAEINYNSKATHLGTYKSVYFESTASFTMQKAALTEVVYPAKYDIDGGFEIGFNYIYGFHTADADHFGIQLNLGKLQLYVDDVSGSANNTLKISYDGTLLAESAETTSNDYVQYKKGVNDEWTDIMNDYMENLGCTNSYNMALQLQRVTCKYENGTLTATIGKQDGTSVKTVTASLTDADFSNSELSIDLWEKEWRPIFLYGVGGEFSGKVIEPVISTPVSSAAASSVASVDTSSTETSSAASSVAASSKANSSAAASSEENTPAGATDADANLDGSNIGTVIIIVAAACVLVAGAAVAFILLRRKKSVVEEDESVDLPTEEE